MSIGMKCIEEVAKTVVGADSKWMVKDSAGYDWWPCERKQSLRIVESPAFDNNVASLVQLSTEVASVSPSLAGAVAKKINELNQEATVGTLKLNSETSTVSLLSAVAVLPMNLDSSVTRLAPTSGKHLGESRRLSLELQRCGAEDAKSDHPTQGRRDDEDEALGFDDIVIFFGQQKNIESLLLEKFNAFRLSSSLVGAINLTTTDSGISFNFTNGLTGAGHIITERHPHYGWGIRTRLLIPSLAEFEGRTQVVANTLNELESSIVPCASFFGSWFYEEPKKGAKHNAYGWTGFTAAMEAGATDPEQFSNYLNIAIELLSMRRASMKQRVDQLDLVLGLYPENIDGC